MKEIVTRDPNAVAKVQGFFLDFGFSGGYLHFICTDNNLRHIKAILDADDIVWVKNTDMIKY